MPATKEKPTKAKKGALRRIVEAVVPGKQDGQDERDAPIVDSPPDVYVPPAAELLRQVEDMPAVEGLRLASASPVSPQPATAKKPAATKRVTTKKATAKKATAKKATAKKAPAKKATAKKATAKKATAKKATAKKAPAKKAPAKKAPAAKKAKT